MHSHPAIQSSSPLFEIEGHPSTVILGGGLAGLSTGFILSEAGIPVKVFEGDRVVGGLSKTISYGEFRFDLGGHRFFTKNQKIKHFITELLSGEFLTVSRKSKIYMRSRFFDYPLKPSNALFGLGIFTSLKAVSEYGLENVKNFFSSPVHVSLEDWVVSNFGRTIFDIYFKEYSEKVWGIECKRISKEWVSQRIKGLSLGVAIKNAFFKFSGRDIDTLADKFIYPYTGIGEISNRLKAKIERGNPVMTGTKVIQIYHDDFSIKGVGVIKDGRFYSIGGSEFVSSIPLTNLIKILDPPPPREILEAASRLRYRDLVIVVIMLRRERVTDLTWVYLPERDIPMGRIHEPKNWSPYMAPQGKTHIVCEYFCFEGDEIWGSSNERLIELTITQLEKLGFTRRDEVIDGCVVRVPKAYPLFEIGYTGHYEKVLRYLRNFKNLHICGRVGMFRYYNMDHAIESGIEVAESILRKINVRRGY
jgi:protoporphyrinogen oxidase